RSFESLHVAYCQNQRPNGLRLGTCQCTCLQQSDERMRWRRLEGAVIVLICRISAPAPLVRPPVRRTLERGVGLPNRPRLDTPAVRNLPTMIWSCGCFCSHGDDS